MTIYAPRHFEDFQAGDRFETAACTLTEGAIADFALMWDPQPFHIDKTFADASVYGGIIASGFHTQLIAFRLVYQSGLFGHNRGGRGIDELRWLKAVKAGDTIRVKLTVAAVTPARTTGHVAVDYDVVDQNDETVMTARFNYVVAKRPAEG